MDLVDIDKVLDDLELNESTNNDNIETAATVTAELMPTATVTTTMTSISSSPSISTSSAPIVIQQCSSNKSNHQLQQSILPIIPTSSHSNSYNDETDHKDKINFEEIQTVTTSNNNHNNNNKIENDRIKNKKYVTVSNVFSSLDDYRRDVESLQQQQQQQQDNFVNIEKLQSDIPLSNDVHNEAKLNDINKATTIIDNEKNKINDDDDNTEDEPEGDGGYTTSSSSITTSSPSSFSSGPSPGSPSIDESGSFVLGNGGGNRQEEQQQHNQIEQIKNNDDDDNDGQIEKDQKNKDKKESKNYSNDTTNDDNNDKKHEEQQQQQQQQENENNKENSELGLSSISSSYLYCENVLSSLPCSSQDMKFDALSSISSTTSLSKMMTTTTTTHTQNPDMKGTDENSKYEKHNLENYDGDNDEKKTKEKYEQSSNEDCDTNPSQDLSKKEQQQQQQQQQQKVVGFGSTMDEISDTELDSILQEIDNDFQMYFVPSQSQQQQQQSSQQTSTVEVNHVINNNTSIDEKSIAVITETMSKVPLSSDKEENGGGDSLSINLEKINLPSSTKSDENGLIDDGDDANDGDGSSSQQYPQTTTSIDDENNLQNADSFSQASTIEFAELRLQTDFDVDINEEKNLINVGAAATNTLADVLPNSSGGSDDNEHRIVESSPVTLSLQDIENENGNNCIIASKQEQSRKHEGNNDDDSNPPSMTLSQKQQQHQQLQRPNSLDLPTQMDVKMYINSTAGQTPPASRLDDISLLSSSSSDDQHLSSSEQQIKVTSSNQQQQPVDSSHSIHSQTHQQQQEQQPQQQQDCNPSSVLGKVAPFWIPDSEAPACMQCKQKFSLIKRRHHCRACGQVFCSVCCSQKAKLAFLGNQEARICIQCNLILNDKKGNESSSSSSGNSNLASTSTDNILNSMSGATNQPRRSPNPNNPMEYCSMISPYQQVGQQTPSSPISVMVPVGVLKREGAPKNNRKDKTVIFSDGIRPGCDLTELDNSWDTPATTTSSNLNKKNSNTASGGGASVDNNSSRNNNESGKQRKLQGVGDASKRVQTPPVKQANQRNMPTNKTQKPLSNTSSPATVATATTTAISTSSVINDENESYIPKESNSLPPICIISNKTEFELKEVQNNAQLIERLQNETLKFAIQRNFYVYVRIVKLKCCVNKTIINFTTQGMHHVRQDEIIILLEYDNSNKIPKDIFTHLNEIYVDADHGYPITELGFSMPKQTNFLESREHGGFLYIRPTFQCLQEIYLPESPYLIGILIHRWEVPWAKIFPLRLMLRLGAEYRYYPSPHISIRGRNSVYAEIAQTIINLLADFRNYSYTLTTIRGMYIHMEDRRTNILIPKNRYEQIVKALNNSSDHILALGANFSKKADGHLVCIQNMEADCPETHSYSTQAINIQGQARKVTGASFIVFNGALKKTSGLTGKCSIVEDGLMVQILPAKMQAVRNSLKNMKDIEIICGPNDVDESQSEIVSIKWTANDTEFNLGVKSPIDGKRMDGIPSIRVRLGLNYSNKNYIIRWTEVFILEYDEDSARNKDPIDISKVSEQIAENTSIALASFLDLLAANGFLKIGLRATLHQENVCYEAGSKNSKLPPLYMNALDNKLIPILHKQATSLDIDTPVVLELIFHILNK